MSQINIITREQNLKCSPMNCIHKQKIHYLKLYFRRSVCSAFHTEALGMQRGECKTRSLPYRILVRLDKPEKNW